MVSDVCVLQVYKDTWGHDVPATIKVIGGADGSPQQAAKEIKILVGRRYAEVATPRT
jgi:hypothetical protein